jgi:hypothetical protein
MQRLHYLDPLGSRLPALERNIMRFRSMQMVLVLFYAEQLKQKVLNLIQNTDSLHARLKSGPPERVPKGVKNQVKECLNALVADGAISADERDEIKRLIDYRNVIGHEVHKLVADLSTERHIRDLDFAPDLVVAYDYKAVDRLRHYLDLFGGQQIAHRYVVMLSMDSLMFVSAERTLLADIRKLNAKILRQMAERNQRLREINEQLKLDKEMRDEEHPRDPLNQYDDKRLTKRGEEVCYRLFDQGKPPMALALLMGISLAAARKRQRMWLAAGGTTRPSVDFDSLPRRKFYQRDDD